MTYEILKNEKIKENELKALFYLENSNVDNAESILAKNIKNSATSTLTYDLLIRIYNKKQDFQSLINILNLGIRHTKKRHFYKKLKKQVILSEIISAINPKP